MPTVTVREYTIDRGHYSPVASGVYPYSGGGGVDINIGSAGISWAGSTANAIGTYSSPRSIIAETNLTFDGSNLVQGTVTEDYLGYSFAYTIGGTAADNITAVEIVGHKTANGTVGSLSFHNVAASQTSKMIAQIYAQRDDNDDYGALNINVAGTAGASWASLRMERASHRWFLANAESMVLASGALYPYSDELLNLGSSANRWNTLYAVDANIEDTLYIADANTYITQDSAGNMVFKDITGGPYELSELVGGSSVSFGTDNQIPVMNLAGNNFEYSANLIYNGTNLQVTSANVLVASTGYGFFHGDGDTGFYESADDVQEWYVGGSIKMSATTTQFTLRQHIVPDGGKIYNLGDTTHFFDNIYCDRIYIDNINTYIDIDSAGEMNFTDPVTGTHSKSDLIGGGGVGSAGISMGAENEIPVVNSTSDDFDYSANFKYDGSTLTVVGTVAVDIIAEESAGVGVTIDGGLLKDNSVGDATHFWTTAYIDTLYVDDVNTYLTVDSAGNLIFKDANGGPYELSELASGGGSTLWQRNGTDLSPLNAGDDVVLAASTERIMFGDKDTYIYESSDDILEAVVAGGTRLLMTSTYISSYNDLRPSVTGTYDLGSSTLFWAQAYIDTLYIDDVNTYLTVDSAGNLVFKDANGGPYELSELAAGGGGGGTIDGSGTAGQYARFTDADTLTSGSELSFATGTLSMSVSTVRISYLAGGSTRIATADADGDLGTGNLSGHVTTSSGLATTLTVASITGQTALTSGLVSTDELLVNDGGAIKRMDVSVLETYMENNMTFPVNVSGTPADNQLAVWTDADTVEGDSKLTWTGSYLKSEGHVVVGNLTSFSGVGNYGLYVGSVTSGYYGALTFYGSQSADTNPVGSIDFWNYSSTYVGTDRLARIRCNRNGNDYVGSLHIDVDDQVSVRITNDDITLRTSNSDRIIITDTTMRPSGTGYDLGDGSNYYANVFAALRSQAGASQTVYVYSNELVYASSDVRLKENIRHSDYDSLAFLVDLPVRRFDLKDGTQKNIHGWIAQEVQEQDPEMVFKNPDGYLSIRDQLFQPHFHKAIQQLYKEIQDLREQVKMLSN